jgi:hypothetical protein
MPRLLPNEQENSLDGLQFGSTHTVIAMVAVFEKLAPHKKALTVDDWQNDPSAYATV